MKLSFKNMIIQLNIFNLEQESIQYADVNIIQEKIYKPIDISDEEVNFESSFWSINEPKKINKISIDNRNSQR